jgi:hypothetical protein
VRSADSQSDFDPKFFCSIFARFVRALEQAAEIRVILSPQIDAIDAKFCIFNLPSISQAGRRGFDPVSRSRLFSGVLLEGLWGTQPDAFSRILTGKITSRSLAAFLQSVGEVGGLWPRMRQGWTFLDDPADDGSTLIASGLIELFHFLRPARFASLDYEGGQGLILESRGRLGVSQE